MNEWIIRHYRKATVFGVIMILSGCATSKPKYDRYRASTSVTDGTLNTYKRESPYAQQPAVPSANPTERPVTVDTIPRGASRSKSVRTTERAKNIATEVIKINGISRTSVVITERTALIGIELDDEIDDSSFNRLRGEVENTAMGIDGNLEHVAVTASPVLVSRIVSMADSVIADSEMQQYYEKVNEIVNMIPDAAVSGTR